jgi:hypothetical protein
MDKINKKIPKYSPLRRKQKKSKKVYENACNCRLELLQCKCADTIEVEPNRKE